MAANRLEQYVVESYTGSLSELKENIESVTGIEKARITSKPYDEVKDRRLAFDISYDPDIIYRYTVCEEVEDMGGVNENVLSS